MVQDACIADMKRVSDNILLRVYVLFGLFLIFGAIILLRIMGLQLNHDYWAHREISERVSFRKVIADRGNIISEEGDLLATSLPYYRLAMDPTVIDTGSVPGFRDSVFLLASNLATHYGEWVEDSVQVNDSTWEYFERKDTLLYANRILKAMREGDRHVYLTRKKLSFREVEAVREWPILNWGRYRGGVIFEKLNNERFYPFEQLAKATLGTIVYDTQPVRGIEYSFHRALKGEDSYILAQKIAGGGELPLNQYGESNAIDGHDVVTTLDVDMQEIVHRALARGVEQSQAALGTAIVLEVETGKIKAIANYPENFNYGIATQLEPGSTFKLISATAAMEDGIIDLCDTVDTGNGIIDYAEQQITDNGAAYGELDFEHVFAKSSNVGVSKVINEGYGAQPERFIESLKRFGFFGPANHQIIGEPTPIVYQPGDSLWNSTTLPSMAIGYSVHVTPLQMATFYNAIANGGKLMRPWLVKEIRDDSNVLERFGPEVVHPRICSPATIEKLNVLLKAVVSYGTASRALKDMDFPVAGKTGTAKKFKYGEYRNAYRASFGGFFPADAPRYTCYVMVDEPIAGGYAGGSIAAPIFREIADAIYRIDSEMKTPEADPANVPVVDLPKVMFAENAKLWLEMAGDSAAAGVIIPDTSWVVVAKDTGKLVVSSLPGDAQVIPDVKGMSARDAMVLLESMGLEVQLRGHGKVRRQSLLPGYRVGKGSMASITLFLG